MKKSVTIIRGIPGSGKTTFAELIADGKWPICCADDYFIDKEGNYNWSIEGLHSAHIYSESRCEHFMKNNTEKIIVSNTSVTYRDMKAYFELAKKYGYKVFSVVVENRHGGINTHGVPDGTIESMKENFNLEL